MNTYSLWCDPGDEHLGYVKASSKKELRKRFPDERIRFHSTKPLSDEIIQQRFDKFVAPVKPVRVKCTHKGCKNIRMYDPPYGQSIWCRNHQPGGPR